jgi:hypothetical protein
MSSLILIEPPGSLPISLAEAKAGARLDGLDDQDALIAGHSEPPSTILTAPTASSAAASYGRRGGSPSTASPP